MKTLFKQLDIDLTIEQENKFNQYYNYLIQENNKYNLTRITNREDVLIKHFYDSLTLVETGLLKEAKSLCDVGSGAGFPGIPIKIIFPHIKLYLVESQTKKARFLTNLIKELNLNDVTIINERSEDIASKYKNSFDIVTARAVSALNILSELTLPLVKQGGHFIAMKGNFYKDELNAAKNGIITLGGALKEVIDIHLPNEVGKRHLIVVKKEKIVEGYPRAYTLIKRKPL